MGIRHALTISHRPWWWDFPHFSYHGLIWWDSPHEFFGSAISPLPAGCVVRTFWIGRRGPAPMRTTFASTNRRLPGGQHIFWSLRKVDKSTNCTYGNLFDQDWLTWVESQYRPTSVWCPVRLYLQTGEGLHLFDVAHLWLAWNGRNVLPSRSWPPRLKIPVLDLAQT